MKRLLAPPILAIGARIATKGSEGNKSTLLSLPIPGTNNSKKKPAMRAKTIVTTVVMGVLLLVASPAWSAYLRNMPVTVKQPDGTEIKCFASGDEFHNWLHDEANYTIIPHPRTGWYCYAEPSGDDVVAGPLVVGRDLPQSRNLVPGINISPALYRQYSQSRFFLPEDSKAPTIGLINNIVIFIRFADDPEFGQEIIYYNGLFNVNANSQREYYLEASYDQLTVYSYFYPPEVNGYVVSWQDTLPRAYYQPYNEATNPDGYTTDKPAREWTLLRNAVTAVDPLIPSDLIVDGDNDSYVDNVVFVVQGSSGAWNSLLWPHRWGIWGQPIVYINGKQVYNYNLQMQDFLSYSGVGVLSHEFFHSLGSPDLYHYQN
ncbi:MAG: hypothetical protein K0B87_06780, partial [Candidatus Syntrophosphaera sp.]|nr:hypothetical protein [Candidatus Syntrophosphaera sp.]